MEKTLKLKSLFYLLISALSFFYLILPQDAGISVPIFIILQFACLYFLVPKKKPLIIFIPVFMLALNLFISASNIWHIPNFLVITLLYSVMTLWMADEFWLQKDLWQFLTKILKNVFKPFRYFFVPFKWCAEVNAHAKTSVRILTGIGISVPCLALLLVVLSSADQIFSQYVSGFFNIISSNLNSNTIFKIVFGFVVGFYLFGLVYSV